jgi:hypothetical protein
VSAGLIDVAQRGPLAPMPERIPHEVVSARNVAARYAAGPGRPPIDIAIAKTPGTPPWDLSLLAIELDVQPAARHAACSALRLRYKYPEEDRFPDWRTVRVAIDPAAGKRTLTIGSTVPLALERDGTLRLEPECSGAATLAIGNLAVIKPLRHIYYRDRYLANAKN